MTCKLSDRVAAAIFDSDLIATRLLAFAEFLWAAMLFLPLEREHCRKAYEAERLGRQLPPEYRR